jgi:hypothetical protein
VSRDLVELLKARIEAAGFVVLIVHIADIRAGLDVGAILSTCMKSSTTAATSTRSCRQSEKPRGRARRF